MSNKFFFMVFVEGGSTPTCKHTTLESAENEAKRLAHLTDKKAWVLCTLKSIEITKYHIEDARPTDSDLPF